MYSIKTCPANCEDLVHCSRLGNMSAHEMMAGYTDFVCGVVRDVTVMIPLSYIVDSGMKRIKRTDAEW